MASTTSSIGLSSIPKRSREAEPSDLSTNRVVRGTYVMKAELVCVESMWWIDDGLVDYLICSKLWFCTVEIRSESLSELEQV